jgi:hypothetical protein
VSNPADGDVKVEGGRALVYREPPGVWEDVEDTLGPLSEKVWLPIDTVDADIPDDTR